MVRGALAADFTFPSFPKVSTGDAEQRHWLQQGRQDRHRSSKRVKHRSRAAACVPHCHYSTPAGLTWMVSRVMGNCGVLGFHASGRSRIRIRLVAGYAPAIGAALGRNQRMRDCAECRWLPATATGSSAAVLYPMRLESRMRNGDTRVILVTTTKLTVVQSGLAYSRKILEMLHRTLPLVNAL
jgi:hypothetical protein